MDQQHLLSDNLEFPYCLLVDTPCTQLDSSPAPPSSIQSGESLFFCSEEVNYLEDSGDEEKEKEVLAASPNEDVKGLLPFSHYASPLLTPSYSNPYHLTPPSIDNGGTVLLSAPWLCSPPITNFSLSPIQFQTTPLHHIDLSSPNPSPIPCSVVYSPSSIFPPPPPLV